MLANLLTNAVKFSERGEIVVKYCAAELTDSACTVEFSVEDQGMGIDAGSQSRLFQRFSQADGTMTRVHGGSGLGLAISKELVEAMGGGMGFQSTLGQGSRFWFHVLFQLPADAAVPQRRLLAGKHVLIRDPNTLVRKILRAFVMIHGGTVAEQENPASTPVDLTILGLYTGAHEELAVARRIAEEKGKLLLIRPFGKRFAAGLLVPGQVAWLSKPVRSARFRARLEELFPTSHAPALPEAALNPALARVLLAEDNLVNRKLALRLLQSLGYQAEAVENGLEAVQAMRTTAYDLILMDCQMPALDGFGATAEIRRFQAGARRTPIIALTAHAMAGDRERCLAADMDDYLSKPLQLKLLAATLERWSPAST